MPDQKQETPGYVWNKYLFHKRKPGLNGRNKYKDFCILIFCRITAGGPWPPAPEQDSIVRANAEA